MAGAAMAGRGSARPAGLGRMARLHRGGRGGLGLALGLALLIAPVTAIVAGLFLDDIAETVERTDYPRDPPGTPVPTLRSIVLSLNSSAS